MPPLHEVRDEAVTETVSTRPRSPSVATALSCLFPGLGQGYAGRRRAAALFAAPTVVVHLAVLLVAAGGIGQLVSLLIDPTRALAVAALIVLLGLWRLASMGDALRSMGRRGSDARRRGTVVFAVLTAAVIVTHGWAGYVAWSFHEAGEQIFVGEDPISEPSDAPGSPRPTLIPALGLDERPPPFATPESATARVNVLMIGLDSAENRTTMLTDTMIVASVDPETGDIAMVSFPRDIADFPLPDGRTFRGKLNSLYAWAWHRPKEFPDGPLATLAGAVGHLLGIPIQYYAAVDLAGFSRMVDAVGGVTVDNADQINDPTYAWPDGQRGFVLSPGQHRLDGRTALAYVRTRKGVGDSDFTRARRQQQVLLALRLELTKADTIARIPALTKAAAQTVSTSFPTDRIGEFIDLALELDDENVEQVVLGPPYSVRARGPDVTDYRVRLDMDRLAALSIELFGSASRYYGD